MPAHAASDSELLEALLFLSFAENAHARDSK